MQIRIADYPQLQLIAWNRRSDAAVDEREALALYEANGRVVDEAALLPRERQLIQHLANAFGAGVLNV